MSFMSSFNVKGRSEMIVRSDFVVTRGAAAVPVSGCIRVIRKANVVTLSWHPSVKLVLTV